MHLQVTFAAASGVDPSSSFRPTHQRRQRRALMTSRMILGAVVVSVAASVACGSSSTATRVQSTTYISTMNGANENPARATPATGTATYTLPGTLLTFVVTVNGLTGRATASHIHAAPAGV